MKKIHIKKMEKNEYEEPGINIYYTFGNSSFGKYLVASTDKGITNVLFFDDNPSLVEDELRPLWPKANIIKKKNAFHKDVEKFFKDKYDKILLHIKGSDFDILVWQALLKIPKGELVTYSALATSIKKPSAQRAVGSAIGRNPIGYIIPCHRVVKSGGDIGEYRWGTYRKMAMIEAESDIMEK